MQFILVLWINVAFPLTLRHKLIGDVTKTWYRLAYMSKPMYIIQLLHTFFGNSENYRPEVLWTTWCTIARGLAWCTIARGLVAIVHQVVHSTEGAIVFTVAQKRFVIVVLLPNPRGGAFCFFIVHRFLFNLTCSGSCIPEFNSRRVTFSICSVCTRYLKSSVLCQSTRTFIKMQNQKRNIIE